MSDYFRESFSNSIQGKPPVHPKQILAAEFSDSPQREKIRPAYFTEFYDFEKYMGIHSRAYRRTGLLRYVAVSQIRFMHNVINQ